MSKIKDLTGQVFGRLTVIKYNGIRKRGKNGSLREWLCKCECGNYHLATTTDLIHGNTTSCGCLHREMVGNLNRKHNLSGGKCENRLYDLWKSIKYRCYNVKNKSYKNYGGRGIAVCDEWKDNFENFYNWAVNNGYKAEKLTNGLNKWTIDRIDVNGNYEPNNCRFITNEEQAKNKRNSIPIEDKKRICAYCGKEFYIKQRNAKGLCCSKECFKNYINKLSKENVNWHTKKPKVEHKKICECCGKEFVVSDGHFNKRKFCSRECQNLYSSPIWEFNGEKHRVVEWAKIVGISAHCLIHRHNEMGWDIEKTLTTKKGVRNGKL